MTTTVSIDMINVKPFNGSREYLLAIAELGDLLDVRGRHYVLNGLLEAVDQRGMATPEDVRKAYHEATLVYGDYRDQGMVTLRSVDVPTPAEDQAG